MNKKAQAARCRQQIAQLLEHLGRLAWSAQGHAPLVRGSFYRFRRKCGKKSCRCARGELHTGQAFSVRKNGRSRAVPLSGVDRAKLLKCVDIYREFRKTRAEMVKTFNEMLVEVDQLERLREIRIERLRQRAGGRK